MRRGWLVLLLMVASAPALAQPEVAVAQVAAATDRAEAAVRDAEGVVARLAVRRAEIARRYQEELAAIDRLKYQRASWRRDRELRDSLSSSLETANQLGAATRELERAREGLATSRGAFLAAIDGELGGVSPAAPSARARYLDRARRNLAAQIKAPPRRIVLPDLEIDPLADPEELDQRVAELRATEDALARQLAGLDVRIGELEHAAQLRRQHDRASEIFRRDDDQPRRNTTRKVTEGGGVSPVAEEVVGGDPSRLPTAPDLPPGGLDASIPVVLSAVIDPSTIHSLSLAQRSGDPAQRAEAAHRVRSDVAARLDQVHRRRAELETRARALRAGH